MKMRRYIYLIVIGMIAFMIYKYGDGRDIAPPQSISKQDVLNDFADLRDNQSIPAGTLGGTFYTTEVFFPDDYVGDQGDEFYVSMEDGHVLLTQKYIIHQIGASQEKSGKLLYKIKDTWENYRPPAGKYESHKYDGKNWTKVNAIDK